MLTFVVLTVIGYGCKVLGLSLRLGLLCTLQA